VRSKFQKGLHLQKSSRYVLLFAIGLWWYY
jgi:hypothetical protein